VDRLASREHLPAFVTPVALEGRRGGGAALWYRVLAGAFTTRDSAVLARAALWANRVTPKGQGDLLRAPYSLSLAQTGRPDRLRGGKMEDVIFQGSTGRRPVNVTEVSLVFDNSDGTLPLAYQEVLVTRRLSRSGQSEYLLNRSPVRLRDIQDLLRGTGLGADAAVVMEARMIEALLSEKAEERRALFEEAAGIGLYRDRKKSTERRLEETAADLARLDDLI